MPTCRASRCRHCRRQRAETCRRSARRRRDRARAGERIAPCAISFNCAFRSWPPCRRRTTTASGNPTGRISAIRIGPAEAIPARSSGPWDPSCTAARHSNSRAARGPAPWSAAISSSRSLAKMMRSISLSIAGFLMPTILREPALSAACEPQSFALLVAGRQRLRPDNDDHVEIPATKPVFILRRIDRRMLTVTPSRSSEGL